ncbi:hypothetical protein [Lysinibacillus fusiformis]|uniref:hypothetical protein n=1 Tax=Lysinibacillus fusiformis TaxID=28031 RepID=UPI003CFE097F
MGDVFKDLEEAAGRLIPRNTGRNLNPLNGLKEKVKSECEIKADSIASTYLSKHPNGDFDDCVDLATAGAIAAATAYAGPGGTAFSASFAPPAARMACRRIFPEQ